MNRAFSWSPTLLSGAMIFGLAGDPANAQTTSRLSISSAGIPGDNDSRAPVVSGDGRFVTFASLATNLVLDDTNDAADVFIHDRTTGQTERVSVDSNGIQGNDSSGLCRSVGTVSCGLAISDNGRFVAFASDADNLVSNDSNGTIDILLRDRETGTTIRGIARATRR